MQINGVIGCFNTVPNRFSKEGQKVLVCTGFKVKGSALDFSRYGLSVLDGATSETVCEDFVSLSEVRQMLCNGARVVGLILNNDKTLQFARNTHLYDYKLYLTEVARNITLDEYNKLFGLQLEGAVNEKDVMIQRGYYTAMTNPNGTIALFSIPKESTDTFKIKLVEQITETNKTLGEDEVTGYFVSMGPRFAKVPMDIDTIAKNADMIEPDNFIVKRANNKTSFSAKPGSSLKGLPVVKFGVKAQVGKSAATGNEGVGNGASVVERPSTGVPKMSMDVSLENVCKLMQKFEAEWMKLSKKGEYVVTVGEQEYEHLGIDVAYPDIKYSATTLNANLLFKKLATTRVEYDDNGYMFEVVNCFSYAARSIYDNKGVKALDNVYMICSASMAPNFVFEMRDRMGIELTEMKTSKSNVSLSYINSGILKYNDYKIFKGDFSHIKTITKDELNWIKGCNIRVMQENMQVLKGERTYLRKHLKSLKEAVDAMKDYTGISVPEKPVCAAYRGYNSKVIDRLKEIGVDVSVGCFNPETKESVGYSSPIVYSIPKVPAITSKDFAKTLSDAKEKILSDKNPLKKKVYGLMFQYLENYSNAVNNCASDLDKIKFIEQCLREIESRINEFTRAFWYYNQWCVTGAEDGEMYIYDNGASELVGTIGNKAECTITGAGDVHNKYMITLDITKVRFANAEQREGAIRKGKFTAPCIYSETAGKYTIKRDE